MNIDHYTLSEKQEHEIRDIKNRIHRYPELSWQEFKTTALIRSRLEKMPGMEILDIGMDTGVTALLRGADGTGQSGSIKGSTAAPAVALRADIDAIEADEDYESDYRSQNPGIMHACGHDFHTASLLGAASILSANRDHIPGNILFIFQPAEETTSGAEKIADSGILEQQNVKAVFGLHNRPEIPAGEVIVHEGPLMAAKINFSIIIHGKGGHGSMPQKCVDPIVCASAVIQGIQTVISRNIDPMEAIVLSICSIHAGTPANLIVDEVSMTGSMRTFSPSVEKRALERLKAIIDLTAQAYECTSEFKIEEAVPAVINQGPIVETARKAAEAVLGTRGVTDSEPGLATEDFAVYMQKVPGFFYWLGSGKDGDPCYSWHNSRFHTNDTALRYGAELLAVSAVELLNGYEQQSGAEGRIDSE
ncbi:MAG: M20 metallopeptidase family protein [Eubacteriaceae bacterium]